MTTRQSNLYDSDARLHVACFGRFPVTARVTMPVFRQRRTRQFCGGRRLEGNVKSNITLPLPTDDTGFVAVAKERYQDCVGISGRQLAVDFGDSPKHLHRSHARKNTSEREQILLKLILFIGLLFVTSPVFALNIPDKPQSYVNDYASLLSAETRQKIEGILGAFEKETSNQVVVAIFPSLEEQVLEDFSVKLAEKWKIGSKKNDNGVILLIFQQEHKVRIEVGYGLEGALPDALAGQIIRTEITPFFRRGDFDGGVLSAVNAILQATRGEYKAKAPAEDPIEKYSSWIFAGIFLYFLIPLLFYVLLIIVCVMGLGVPGAFLSAALVIILEFLRKIFFSSRLGNTLSSRGGGFGGGFGGSSSFGGGGFGGGGGGSFGGGGASGGW